LLQFREAIELDCEAFVTDAISFMKQNNVRRIVVVDNSQNKKILGVLTVDEVLHHILNNTVETKLKYAVLREPIIMKNFDIKVFIKEMLSKNTDNIIIDTEKVRYIVTYKDLIRLIDWSRSDDTITSIAKKAISVERYTKIRTAISLMLNHKIRHLPVYEDTLYGIISARDIVYRYLELDLNNDDVSKIMVINVFNVSPDDKIYDVVTELMKRNIGSVIVDERQIVTLKDLLEYALKKLIR
jgi:predicted transcriptional regulator